MRPIGYMPVISPARAANMATHAWIKPYTETLVWSSLRLTPITIILPSLFVTITTISWNVIWDNLVIVLNTGSVLLISAYPL